MNATRVFPYQVFVFYNKNEKLPWFNRPKVIFFKISPFAITSHSIDLFNIYSYVVKYWINYFIKNGPQVAEYSYIWKMRSENV